MENITDAAASCTLPPSNHFTRRIGRTTYKVSVTFSEKCRETFEDKVLRLIRAEVLDNTAFCGIMNVPQMSCAVERSN